MTTQHNARKRGVALIIVLGMLAVLTILAVAFAISMRIERLAARNFADGARASQLIHAALARAMTDINKNMTVNALGNTDPLAYPFRDGVDAICSQGGSDACTDILPPTGEAPNSIPDSLLNGPDVGPAAQSCRWIDITVSNAAGTPAVFGKVAYLAVNCSGLLDANYAGGEGRTASVSVAELDLSGLSEFASGGLDTNTFFKTRQDHLRFETVPELLALLKAEGWANPAINNFFTYSMDIGRDVYFTDTNNFGMANAALQPKFDVNAVTNYSPPYTSPEFRSKYFDPLVAQLRLAGITWKPEDVAWNIVNWIDTDRYPQGGTTAPHLHTEGGEAMPLINEIVCELSGASNAIFKVELWYPFVFVDGDPGIGNYSYSLKIEARKSTGGPTVTEIFPIDMGAFQYPANQYQYYTQTQPITGTSNLQIKATVRLTEAGGSADQPVDAAMDRTGETLDWGPEFYVSSASPKMAAAIDDPRSNGKDSYWMATENETLGRFNDANVKGTRPTGWTYDATSYGGKPACQPWKWQDDNNPAHLRQGLPIMVRNGPMKNIGEIGYIFMSNRENANPAVPKYKWYWSTIDLMHKDEGAYLLDHLTVRQTNAPMRGLVSISTKQEDILKALLYQSEVGYTGRTARIDNPSSINLLKDAINDRRNGGQKYISFQDLFDGEANNGGAVAQACRDLGTDVFQTKNPGDKANDAVREAPFRNILDLITFRQNIFTIVMAARLLGPDEDVNRPLAERRALATIYRDSYTGAFFVRSFKWLND